MARKYPHLLPADRELWERFLQSPYNNFSAFDYDVKVGTGRDPGPDFSEKIRQMAIDASCRRIDAVGYRPQDVTIIEISVSAGLTQLGQLLCYPCLYKTCIGCKLPMKRLLVAEQIQTDIEPVLQNEAIPYLVLPKPEEES